jgi:hypothetical protein
VAEPGALAPIDRHMKPASQTRTSNLPRVTVGLSGALAQVRAALSNPPVHAPAGFLWLLNDLFNLVAIPGLPRLEPLRITGSSFL